MKDSGSYDAGRSHRDFESEMGRLRTQALLSWEKEARALGWYGLQDGMSVLELGSGSSSSICPILWRRQRRCGVS